MAETNEAFDVPQNWATLSSLSGYPAGTELVLQNIGLPGDLIDIAFSETEPGDTFNGVALDQVNQIYQLPPSQFEAWVRFRRLDKRENLNSLVGRLQVQEYTAITTYAASVPGSAITFDGVDGYRMRVSSEEAAVNSAFKGDVWTVSGEVLLSGTGVAALNFDVEEQLIHISTVANCQAEVEISIRNEQSLGASVGLLTPINRNLTSDKTISTTVEQVTNATPQGGLVDFATDHLGRSVITDAGYDFSIIIERRDQGTDETVKFAATFEIIPKPPSIPDLMTYNGEALTYNEEDLFYVA